MEGNAKSQLRARVRVPPDPAHGPKYRTGDGGRGRGLSFWTTIGSHPSPALDLPPGWCWGGMRGPDPSPAASPMWPFQKLLPPAVHIQPRWTCPSGGPKRFLCETCQTAAPSAGGMFCIYTIFISQTTPNLRKEK